MEFDPNDFEVVSKPDAASDFEVVSLPKFPALDNPLARSPDQAPPWPERRISVSNDPEQWRRDQAHYQQQEEERKRWNAEHGIDTIMPMPGPDAAVGRAIHEGVVRPIQAGTQDLAETMRGEPTMRNMVSVFDNPSAPTPLEQEIKDVTGVPRYLAQFSQAAPDVIVKSAIGTAAGRFGVTRSLSPTTDAAAATAAHRATIATFGLTPEGFDPKSAAVVAAFGVGSGLAADWGASLIKRGVLQEGSTITQKVIETAGGQIAGNIAALTAELPRLVAMPHEERRQAIKDIVFGNLAFVLMDVPKFRGAQPSAAQAELAKDADWMALKVEKVLLDQWAKDDANRKALALSDPQLRNDPRVVQGERFLRQGQPPEAGNALEPGRAVDVIPGQPTEAQPDQATTVRGQWDTPAAPPASPIMRKFLGVRGTGQRPESLNDIFEVPVEYAGYQGKLGRDAEGTIILLTDDGKAVEIADAGKDLTKNAQQLGVHALRKPRAWTFEPDGSVTIDERRYVNPQTNIANGVPVSVTVTDPATGKPITIRDSVLALDIGNALANRRAQEIPQGTPRLSRLRRGIRVTRKEQNAANQIDQQTSSQPEHTGVPPGENVRTDIEQVRQETGGQTGGGSGPLDATKGTPEPVLIPEEPKTQTMVRPEVAALVDLPVADLHLSSDVPNFKEGASADTGVVEGEELQGKFNSEGVGPIIVWERKNGRLEVISGRHRLDLAKRSGTKLILSQVFREADGFTKEHAMILDAELNIKDGQGAVKDYANYFKHHKNLTRDEAESRGLLSRFKGRAGWALGRLATDDLYSLYSAGKISERHAVAIAEAAPGNADYQRIGIRAALAGADPESVRARIEAARSSEGTATGKQSDFFSNTDLDAIWSKQADYVAAKRRSLNDIVLTRRAVLKRFEAATGTGSISADRTRAEAEFNQAQGEMARWAEWWKHPDLKAEVEAGKPVAIDEAPPAPKPDLTLDQPESIDAQTARLAAEEAVKASKAAKEKVADKAAAPLIGTTGDIGQGDLLGGGDLFGGPTPPPTVPAPTPPKPVTPQLPAPAGSAPLGIKSRPPDDPVIIEQTKRRLDMQARMTLKVNEDTLAKGEWPNGKKLTADDRKRLESDSDIHRARLGIPKPAANAPAYGTENKLVSKERAEELRAKLRKKLGENLTIGIDPELFTMGMELAAYHIEAGARKFADFSRRMLDDLGEKVKPYLRDLYNLNREKFSDLDDDSTILTSLNYESKTQPISTIGKDAGTGTAESIATGAKPDLGGSSSPGTDRIVVARKQFTPDADTSVIPPDLGKHLSPHQAQGAALSIAAMEAHGGMLLADGTGVGKTREGLTVAEYYRRQGYPVVYISKNEALGKVKWDGDVGTISGSVKNDAQAMGIKFRVNKVVNAQPGEIVVSTYENIDTAAEHITPHTVLILDEAHALKNADSQRSRWGMQALDEAKAVLYMTATPADKVQHIDYLRRMGILEGKTTEQAYEKLGLKKTVFNKLEPLDPKTATLSPGDQVRIVMERGDSINGTITHVGDNLWRVHSPTPDDNGRTLNIPKSAAQSIQRIYQVEFWQVDPKVGLFEVLNRFERLYERMTKQGTMMKRELSLKGVPVFVETETLPPEAHQAMAEIDEFFGGLDNVKGLKKAVVLGHMRRQQEPYKIPIVAMKAKADYLAGRQVVIFVSRVNESEVGKWKTQYLPGGEVQRVRQILMTSEGTAKSLKAELVKMGIPLEHIAEIHGGAEETSSDAMARFQSGKAKITIATVESGGTGINLDDSVGNAPRTLIMMTAPFSAVENVQAIGRIWRLMTRSNSHVYYLFGDTRVDKWNRDIIGTKMQTLGAVVAGEVGKIDVSNPDMISVEDLINLARPESKDRGVPVTAMPQLAWEPYTSKAGNAMYRAPANDAFFQWYNANRQVADKQGIRVSKFQGRWTVWARELPEERHGSFQSFNPEDWQRKPNVIGYGPGPLNFQGADKFPSLLTHEDTVAVWEPLKQWFLGQNLDTSKHEVQGMLAALDMVRRILENNRGDSLQELAFWSEHAKFEADLKVQKKRPFGGTDYSLDPIHPVRREYLMGMDQMFKSAYTAAYDRVVARQEGRVVPNAQPLSSRPDLSEPARFRQDVFSLQLPQLPQGAGRPVIPGRPDQTGKGLEEFSRVILADNSGLPADVRQVIRAMMDTPVLRDLDWSHLAYRIAEKIDGNFMGAVYPGSSIMEFSRSMMTAETFPHEMAHFLWEMLPDARRRIIEHWRLDEIGDWVKNWHTNVGVQTPPEVVDLLRSIIKGMSSDQFVEARNRITEQYGADIGELVTHMYPLINGSEFLAAFVGERFAQSTFAQRHATLFQDVFRQVKGWWNTMIETVRSFFGGIPKMDQVYEDLIAGKYLNRPTSGSSFERRLSISHNKEDALNAEALARTVEEREVEGAHQLAQGHDIADFMEKHGVGGVAARAAEKLHYVDYLVMTEVGERLTGARLGYRDLKANVTDSYQLMSLARVAASQWNRLGVRLDKVIEARNKLAATMAGPAMRSLIAKEQVAKLAKDATELNLRIASSVFDSAIKLATKALEQERHSDLAAAKLEGQLRELKEVQKSHSALEQLLTDMVATLSSSPGGVGLLTTAGTTRNQILTAYRTLKQGQPLHNPTLLEWGSYVLNKSKVLRDQLLASQLAQQSQIRNAMNAYQTKFLADYENDPVQAVRQALRERGSMTSDKEKAAFAWQTIHKELMDKFKAMAIAEDAAQIAVAIKTDPDAKALEAEIRRDAKYVGNQEPLKPFISDDVLLPSGQEVSIATSEMVGAKTEFGNKRGQFETAITELQTWLADPANADNLNFGTHQLNLQRLQEYYYGLSMMLPNDSLHLFRRSFEILWNVADQAGGRVSAQLRHAIRGLEREGHEAQWWIQRSTHVLSETRQSALRSHELKWGEFKGLSLTEANRIWWEAIGNQLAYSYNRQAGGLRPGDPIGTAGWRVTAEDIADLRAAADAATKAFGIPADQITKETLLGANAFRRALKGNELMTPRVFDDGLLQSFATPYVNAQKEFKAARKINDPVGMAVAEQKMLTLIDKHWTKIGYAFTWDRNPDFAKETPFDGQGGAFQILAARMESAPHSVQNSTDYFNELAGLSALSVDDVQKAILAEWGRIIGDWHREAGDDADTMIRAEERKNSFTRSRNESMAPYVFYQNGFKSSESVARFGSYIYSRAMDTVAAGLKAVIADLERQKGEFKTKVDAATARGIPKAERHVIQRNAIERANGDNYDEYQDLTRRIAIAKDALNHLLGDRSDSDIDVTVGRYIGAMTGALIGGVATARNAFTGPRYLGQVALRLSASHLQSWPLAAWYGWIDAQMRVGLSVGYGALKSVVWDATTGTFKAIKEQFTDPSRRGVRPFLNTAMRGVFEEMGTNVYMRLKEIKTLIDAGYHHIPDSVKEFDNRLMGSMLTAGRILENDMPMRQRLIQAVIAVPETFLLLLQKTIAPLAGDTALNLATINLLKSSVGPIHGLERALRRIHVEYRKSGYRAFNFNNPQDVTNVLSHNEVFPRGLKRLSSNEMDMVRLRRMFEQSGLNFDERAAVFLAELEHGNMQAQFLTEHERMQLIDRAINDANRPSKANNPLNLRRRTFLNNAISPFMFWKVRTLAQFESFLAQPTKIEGGAQGTSELQWKRAMMWGGVMMTTVLPMLIAGALIGTGEEEETRGVKSVLYNQVSATRQPWERQGLKSQTIGWSLMAANGIPFLDMAVNAALNDMPNRASLDPSLVVIEKMKDAARYAGGVAQTGDPFYKLPQLIGGFFPDAKILINRLASEEGKVEAGNMVNLMRREGPTELLRPGGSQTSVNVTPLTPFADKMLNAAMRGDSAGFQAVYEQAVEKAREMGKSNPERAVAQIFAARNPYNRAFTQKLTEVQRDEFLNRLSPSARAMVQAGEGHFAEAASTIKAPATFTKEESVRARLSRNPSPGRRVAASRLRRGRSGARASSAFARSGSRVSRGPRLSRFRRR